MAWFLTFIKNPKNILILVLAALVLVGGAAFLIQRVSIAKQKTTIATQAKDIEGYKQAQVAYQTAIGEYEDQVVKLKKLNESHQAISDQTAKEIVKIKYIKSKCTLEGEDAKVVNNLFNYFNHGLRSK